MGEEELQVMEEFLADIEGDIGYIMDSYYSGLEVNIIDKIREKYKQLKKEK